MAPPQSASLAQPPHVLVAVRQIGVAPLQLVFVRHWTQTSAVVSHTGFAPVHFVLLVPEHSPHAPVERHAGSAAGQLASEVQPVQTFVVVLHTGAAIGHCWFVRHATHTFGVTAVLHTGLAAGHWALVVHWSMTMSVGGCPAAEPLPSVGVVVCGAPRSPEAVMFA